MKLLTLNTHSVPDRKDDPAVAVLANLIEAELPDIIALQEVNQLASAMETALPEEYITVYGAPVPLKEGNFLLKLTDELRSRGLSYTACYLPMKLGYGKYDEGLAFLCLKPPLRADGFYISQETDYKSWQVRMALKINYGSLDFYNLHMSRYDNKNEPFEKQWERLRQDFTAGSALVLMGDLNCPSEVREEGYDIIIADGFCDLYASAREKTGDITVPDAIDGWRDKNEGKRIDFILTRPLPTGKICYRTVLDGRSTPKISDHFGVLVEF